MDTINTDDPDMKLGRDGEFFLVVDSIAEDRSSFNGNTIPCASVEYFARFNRL